MKVLLFLILTVFTFIEAKTINYVKGDNIYICDFPSKINGKLSIVFVVTENTLATIITYKISFEKEKILKVKKQINPHTFQFDIIGDGNVFIEGLKMECFKHDGFKDKRNNSLEVYELISPKFWDITNQERLTILDNLIK